MQTYLVFVHMRLDFQLLFLHGIQLYTIDEMTRVFQLSHFIMLPLPLAVCMFFCMDFIFTQADIAYL